MRARIPLLAAAAAAALAAGCADGRYRLKERPVATRSWAGTFPSGLRVVAAEVPGLDRFSLAMSYGAGAADDPPGEEGLAHLVEHLAFRARPGGPGAPPLSARLAASGWRWNAFTSHDDTSYVTSGAPGELAAALAIEAARLADPLAGVSARDLEVEREVVLAELRERFESDEGELGALLLAAFSRHRYGRAVGGDPATLARSSLDDLRAFARERYAPARAVLAVASPLPAEELLPLLARAFGEAPRPGVAGAPEPPPPAPGPPGPPTTVRAPLERPRVWVGWAVPGRFAEGALHPDLLATVMEAASAEELRRHWLADHVVAADAGFTDVGALGVLWVRVELDDERLAPRAADAVRAAARELGQRYRIARELVDRVSDQARVAALLALEDLDAAALARHLRATGDPDLLGAGARRAAAQLREDEGPYARRFLAPARAAVVVAAPDRNVAARGIAPSAPPRAAQRPEPLDEAAADPAAAPGPEAARAVAEAPPLEVERRVLANGLEVVLARRGTLPVAEVRLVVRTAPQGSGEVPSGLPSLALSHSTTQLARARSASVGAKDSVAIGAEQVVLRERGSSANLDVLLESAARWAKEQRFGAPQFEAAQRLVQRRLHFFREEAPERAWWLLDERLFPGHPYGTHATAEGVARLEPGQAERWLDRQLRPERATLLVVSDQPPSPAWWARVEQEFGGWRAGGRAPPPALPEPALPLRRTVEILERPGASEALVLVGLRAPPAAARDEAATAAARWLLATRLDRRLRAEAGATYGVRLVTVDRARAAAVVVAVRVQAEDAGLAARSILEAAAALGASPPGPAAVAAARWRVARALGQRWDTVGGTAAALQELALRGEEPAARGVAPGDVAALGPERLREAAARLAAGREVVVVLGDPALVRGPLAEAGLEAAPGPPRAAAP